MLKSRMTKSQRKVTRLGVIIGIILLEIIILLGVNKVELVNNDKSPFVGMYGDNLREFVHARHLYRRHFQKLVKRTETRVWLKNIKIMGQKELIKRTGGIT